MADFDLTQTDAQVQSILDDAQDAMGAGAQTTLTTDYIMLKDTSGNYHKILKDSFTEACRNVLAGLLVNNDKGTTISQIPAIASGDFGSVTPANLASVLGVNTLSSINDFTTTPATSFANQPAASTRFFALMSTGIDTDFWPSGIGAGCFGLSMKWDANAGAILLFAYSDNKIIMKRKTTIWQSWVSVTLS